VAHGDWSMWMMWRREEIKKHKVKAKVDMEILDDSFESYLVSSPFG